MSRSVAAALALALVLAACGDASTSPIDAGAGDAGSDAGTDAGTDAGVPDAPRFLTTLSSPDDLATLTSTIGGGVKYLARVEGRPIFEPLTERCYFQDMSRYSWHLEFLRSFPEHTALAYDAYLALVLRRASRRLWGGAVEAHAGAIHPVTSRPGVLAWVVYSEVNGLSVDDVVAAHAQLAACIPFASALLTFVPDGTDQRAFLVRSRAELTARGVASLFPEELLRGLDHQAYSRGEGYGTLRVVPRGQPLVDYGPRDVVVVEAAPNDISVVAGLVTASPQNALGHVNLRLQEKGIPNVAVPNVYDASWIDALADHLVHLVVTDDAVMIEPARLEDAQRFWDAHRPSVPPPRADLSVTAIADYRTLGHDDAIAYGAKAANLAELRAILAPPAVNDGFAIPLVRYRDYARAIGVEADVDVMLADPRLTTDAAWKRTQLDALRRKLRRGDLPATLLAEVEAQALATFGEDARTLKLRFRSSTNVEDLEALTGAGLYDSKSGCLADDLDGDAIGPSRCLTEAARVDLERQLTERRAELEAHPERTWLVELIADLEGDLTDEKPVADAVRKVWASLWSERAFDERVYYGIDHRLAYMAIAVNPSFQVERASSVVVTNLRPDAGLPLYRVSSQVGDVSVVRPEDPTAISELFTMRRNGSAAEDVAYQSWSSLMPPETAIYGDAERTELARLVFLVHDHFATNVYPSLDPARFDLEVKLTASGDVVVKQVRPYVSRDPSGQ
ncbi:PEP/pyruvate-binding domain-containing protein [Myxococcota bacterium]|nr:PEP/pyruvate-binding domain-containing protein [Myxococcota bacterium]